MPKRKQMQTYGEMLSENEEHRGNRLYKAESSEFVDGQLRELVGMSARELAEIADQREPINIADVATLKERTILYVRACSDTSAVPTFSGLARSVGVSTEALNDHMRRHPNSDSTEWLKIVHDSFADTLATAALRNMTNSIVSIFSLKSRSGWRDNLGVELLTPDTSLISSAVDAATIAARYTELPSD